MAGQTLGPLPPYWTIGRREHLNLMIAMKRPLSGYIGGQPSTGRYIKQLSEAWRAEFRVGYAIPCNSATSGLMAACMAADIGEGDEVWVSTYTMSATATCAMMLGATVKFVDVEPMFFCWSPSTTFHKPFPKAIIVTNLFGCAAQVSALRGFCDEHHIILIEDNAQAPYATCNGVYAGTIGHIGVFSLNVHKHIQCGEGGVIVTNIPRYGEELEWRINHGELAETKYQLRVQQMGGNWRMTEPIAAIACAQLKMGFSNVQSRIALAEAVTDIFRQVAFVEPPAKRSGDLHAYYLWAGKVIGTKAKTIRSRFIEGLVQRGVPFKQGYSQPLHQLFRDHVSLPVAEELERERLFTFEICAYDPKVHHLRRMRDIILEEADKIEKEYRGGKTDGREQRDPDPLPLPGSH